MSIKQIGLKLLPGLLLIGLQSAGADETNPEQTQDTATVNEFSESNSEDEVIAKDSAALQSDVDDVRGQVLQLDKFLNDLLFKNYPKTNRPLNLSGSLSSRFSAFHYDKSDSTTFVLPSASLGFKGILFKDYADGKNLTYSLGFLSSGGAAPTVTDANIGYTLIPTSDPEYPTLTLALGQQKKPFGAEAQGTEENQPSVVGSSYLSGAFKDVSARDLGFVIKGDFFPIVDNGYNYRSPILTYNLGVFNGTGANISDNNLNKEFVGRVILAPPVDYNNFLRGLTIGGSYAYSEVQKTATSTYISKKATTVKIPTGLPGKDSVVVYTTVAAQNGTKIDTVQGARERIGFDVSYIRTPVNLTAEGVIGREQNTTVTNKATDSVATFNHSEKKYVGGSVTLFLNIGEQFLKGYREQSRPDDWWPFTWQPFLRVDAYDQDKNVDGATYKLDAKGLPTTTVDVDGRWQAVGTLGANLFFARTTKLQANYRQIRTQDIDKYRHEYHLQFTYGF